MISTQPERIRAVISKQSSWATLPTAAFDVMDLGLKIQMFVLEPHFSGRGIITKLKPQYRLAWAEIVDHPLISLAIDAHVLGQIQDQGYPQFDVCFVTMFTHYEPFRRHLVDDVLDQDYLDTMLLRWWRPGRVHPPINAMASMIVSDPPNTDSWCSMRIELMDRLFHIALRSIQPQCMPTSD
jgi:hypothetical protein